MLKELRCASLAGGQLCFGSGLNVLTGSDDGANSIGKSSVLMLLDFAFAGDDFIRLCADVIENVGVVTVEVDFVFDGAKYSFSRNTNDSAVVVFMSEQGAPEKTIDEYRDFLKNRYCFPDQEASFRGAVNPFFRVWGKDNYNPNKPLNSFPSEPYTSIKPTLLKLFSLYKSLRGLEKEKSSLDKKKLTLRLAAGEGYIKTVTKSQAEKAQERLEVVETEILQIKGSLNNHSINATEIINESALRVKSEKDRLARDVFSLKGRLKRIVDNLTYGNTTNRKAFEKLEEFFPGVDAEKLAKIDQFHSGITRILKAELREEKALLEEQISSLETELASIEQRLLTYIRATGKPTDLIDRLLELSSEEKDIRDNIRFRNIATTIEDGTERISKEIRQRSASALSAVEERLNSLMSKYINKFYSGNPVSPLIKLSEKKYDFIHNEDSGTGKAYANMIAMDMSFLEATYLPVLIHDLIVFSNIEDHAIERILAEYAATPKQVFIAIDKVSRFNKQTQRLVKSKEFLALGSDRVAFGKSWKNRA